MSEIRKFFGVKIYWSEDYFNQQYCWHVLASDDLLETLRSCKRLLEKGFILDVDCGGFIGHNYVHEVSGVEEKWAELTAFFANYWLADESLQEEVYGSLYITVYGGVVDWSKIKTEVKSPRQEGSLVGDFNKKYSRNSRKIWLNHFKSLETFMESSKEEVKKLFSYIKAPPIKV